MGNVRTILQLKMKTDFPLLAQDITYLDSAATSQKPQVVLDALNEYYTKFNANVHRSVYKIAEIATVEYEKAREIVANFINADEQEVVFTSGTTASINMVARMLEPILKESDEIVITIAEHHSNFIPWQQLAKRVGAKLKIINLQPDNTLDIEDAKYKITSNTRIVAFTGYSNVLGDVMNISEILSIAKSVGALTIIDAAQLIAHRKVDVKNLDCDFLAFSGHKICGPTGIGVLYGKREHLMKLEPVVFGGEMIKDVTLEQSTWNDIPWKFEAGTPKIAQAIALRRAIQYLQSINYYTKEDQVLKIVEYAKEQLKNVPNLTLIPTCGSIVLFTMSNAHPHDVGEILGRENVCIRGGHHCTQPLHNHLQIKASNRASFFFYNTKEDVDKLVHALKKVNEVFK